MLIVPGDAPGARVAASRLTLPVMVPLPLRVPPLSVRVPARLPPLRMRLLGLGLPAFCSNPLLKVVVPALALNVPLLVDSCVKVRPPP